MEQILEIRISTIQALLDIISRLISHLLVVDERPRWCRHAEWMGPHRCESMILGSVTFCLSRADLWPLPKAEDVSDSIVGLHRKLKGLVIHDIGKADGMDHATCNPGPQLLSEVERIYTEVPSPVTNFQAEKMDEQMKRLTNS
ncbi:hypothetical protein NW752_009429 [Fusarium irregulare]|nr:hypothetical protein NW752_009429 [Fusarium irregulare]